MDPQKPKTLDDFPKFVVTALRRGTTSSAGYTHYEIDGKFDQIIEKLSPHWFWLLFGERGCLCASTKSIDKVSGTMTLTCEAQDEPRIVGQALAYLSPYWQAFDVWMVLDPNWGWQKTLFQAVDAIAEDFESKDVSILEGREVKFWTKLEPAEKRGSQVRHYPVTDEIIPSQARLVPSGWDHEHCELCKSHIDAGMYGYCDPGNRWLCESCFERYVTRHDLAFVDEI